jgi:predicted metal-dependent hydrolase
MKTITLPDGRKITYELTRKNVRNINMRFGDDGTLKISAPKRVTVTYIENLISERGASILSAAEKLRNRDRKSDITAKSAVIFGQEYPVRIIESPEERAAVEGDEIRVYTVNDVEENICGLVREAVCEALIREIKLDNARIRDTLAQSGLVPPPTVITVKDMKTRWGSCSYNRGRISINLRLAAFPREALTSVMWHEYAHYWHHDHSAAFYKFVRRFYPEYDRANKLLKE